MANVEIKITNELLEDLNKYRSESRVFQDIFEKIKMSLADQETEICELQSYMYDIESSMLGAIIEDEKSYTVDSELADENMESF